MITGIKNSWICASSETAIYCCYNGALVADVHGGFLLKAQDKQFSSKCFQESLREELCIAIAEAGDHPACAACTFKSQKRGNDVGTQYRSGIYFYTPEQEKAARESLAQHQKLMNRKIVTEILPAKKFYRAEEYHQQYLEKGADLVSSNLLRKAAMTQSDAMAKSSPDSENLILWLLGVCALESSVIIGDILSCNLVSPYYGLENDAVESGLVWPAR
ncbi:Peptide methionine sulfoxide reductase A4, chloroplastic [Vitis vinifera]|uniref:peptide-methionine (S)-S-oxide reductase n=1 Tax=Vitis vinifera TaxID=29760 RepID=A0A438IN32_VITVI|nr:Peptide methionine sulfoxide reductase A4, chloroplastic [Vitis vinifera]